ncbi:7TM diverse intracellular signaling domain-containing protein [Marinobacter sediminum]|uniref:7TM diverse intracellular signaling domain-containing protein n=1 Tax=Marinobacter sediminum TaxID=256323 RepID=UPI00193AD30B|nr:7TM diverse intracellular signaling domain-containing protein [Marinobacter sediminum]
MGHIGLSALRLRAALVFLLLLLSSDLWANENSAGFLDLASRIEVFEGDWDNPTRPAQSKQGWTPMSETSFRAQDTRQFIWLRTELTSSEITSKPFLLLHPYAQNVQVYVDGEAATAEPVAYWSHPEQRPLPHHFIAIPLDKVTRDTKAGKHTIHIRIEPHMHINTFFYLLDDRELVKELTFHTALAFALLAIIIIMAIYNLFLYFSVRDRVYLIYVAASLATLAYSSLLMNVQVYFLDVPDFSPKIGFFAGLSSLILHVLLFQKLLDTKRTYPRIHKFSYGLTAFGVAWLISAPLLTFTVLLIGWMAVGYTVYLGALVLAIPLAIRGYRPARYFLVGWIPYLAAIVLTSFEYASLIEPTNWASYFVPAALSWEMALFSLALASRIKTLRDERDTLLAHQIQVSETAREALERSNRIKDDFLNAVSHELRTPLHTIQGQLDLLQDAPFSTEQIEALRLIERANLRVTRQVGGILDFVDAQGDNLLTSPQVFEPKSLFDLLSDEFREAAMAKPIALTFRMSEKVPTKISMDGLMLEKVLYQLIDNAVKFTPAGGEVLVQGDQHQADSVLHIVISDTGPGIRDDQREKVFQAFRQGEAGLTRRYGGVGLGLPLASSLVSALGGHVTVVESSDQGTTLEVTVPYGDVHQSGVDELSVECHQPANAVPKVLVVEDDACNQKIIRKQLERLGAVSKCVQNGEEAVKAAINEPWDLILMDCQMPIMDGIEATREIRLNASANLDTPIIAVTANASESFRIQCLEAGMDDYYTKPLRMENLKRLVARHAEA